jgi:hypothetical protein
LKGRSAIAKIQNDQKKGMSNNSLAKEHDAPGTRTTGKIRNMISNIEIAGVLTPEPQAALKIAG